MENPDQLEILFENRNKSYGAYPLRRLYGLYLGRATGIVLLLIALFVLITRIIPWMTGRPPLTGNPVDVIVEMMDNISIDHNRPQPPRIEAAVPPPAAVASNCFLPPVVRADNEVLEARDQKDIQTLFEDQREIGTENREGTQSGPPSLESGPSDIDFIPVDPPKQEKTFEVFDVQKPPSFPGGEEALVRYLSQNIRYPEMARIGNFQGRVVLTFVVDRDGQVRDVTLIKDIGGGCGQEAVRVVRNMPQWIPGEANGTPVKVRYTLPVTFRLN